MIVDTAMGPFEVEKENIYRLPQGLLGFEQTNQYALLVQKEDDVSLKWFQAIDSADGPCFVVFAPDEVVNGYDPVLEASDLRALGCALSDLDFLLIAVVPDDVSKTTVNLKSPIAINRRTNTAYQVILANPDYPIRFPLVLPEDDLELAQ